MTCQNSDTNSCQVAHTAIQSLYFVFQTGAFNADIPWTHDTGTNLAIIILVTLVQCHRPIYIKHLTCVQVYNCTNNHIYIISLKRHWKCRVYLHIVSKFQPGYPYTSKIKVFRYCHIFTSTPCSSQIAKQNSKYKCTIVHMIICT